MQQPEPWWTVGLTRAAEKLGPETFPLSYMVSKRSDHPLLFREDGANTRPSGTLTQCRVTQLSLGGWLAGWHQAPLDPECWLDRTLHLMQFKTGRVGYPA